MADRTLFLHIGLPKTGSTWLQERILPSLDHLETRLVPVTRLFAASDDAACGFRLFACALRRSAEVWKAQGDEMFDELLHGGDEPTGEARDLLISDEAIGRAGSRPELLGAHLRELSAVAARRGFGATRVGIIVRRQDTWLASHFAQISDRNPFAGQARFQESFRLAMDPAHGRYRFGMLLDYAALYAALETAVGPGRVLALPYEAFQDAPDQALGRLLRWLGTPLDRTEALVIRANERINERSAGGRSWHLRPPSVAVPRSGRRVSLPALLWPKRQIGLTAGLSHDILASYESRNRAFGERAGLDLARYGYF